MSEATHAQNVALGPSYAGRTVTDFVTTIEELIAADRCDCGQTLSGHLPVPAPLPWYYGRPCAGKYAPKPARPEWNFTITGSLYGRKPKGG